MVQHEHFFFSWWWSIIHSVWRWPLPVRGNIDLQLVLYWRFFHFLEKLVSLDTKSPTLPIPHVSWKKTRYKDLHNSECIYYSTQVGSSYLHENTLPFLWEWALHPSVFVKPQHRYGQIMTIKMAPQNELSSYFFQIITQENYPRTSIIFNVPLQTHVSLCQNHRFKVINQNRLILSFPLQMKLKNFLLATCMRLFEIWLREALDITLRIVNDLIICILSIRVSPLHFHVLNVF